jgi:hypothetical protein
MLVVIKLDSLIGTTQWKSSIAKKIWHNVRKIIKISRGFRTPVLRHLKTQHGIDIKQQSEMQAIKDAEPAAKRVKTIAVFPIPKQNLPEIVSKITIGASIGFITRTKFIHARGLRHRVNDSGVVFLL